MKCNYHKFEFTVGLMVEMERFEFTQGGILNRNQRQFYEDNGYIVIKNNVSEELLEECRQRFIDICNTKSDRSVMIVMADLSLQHSGAQGEYLISRIQDFLFDDILFKYASYKPIIDVVASIIGPNITAFHSMIVNKPPNANPKSSLHPMHQDLHYFPFRPANRIVAAWTAMEKVDEKNGCLYAIPGTHKGKMFPHSYPKDYKTKFFYGIHGLDHLTKSYIRMEKGDTVFFHPLLLHGSGPNFTNGFRKAISCHYADTNCDFIETKGTSYENAAVEAEQMLANRGLKVTFSDAIKLKSRLITGPEGNFQKIMASL